MLPIDKSRSNWCVEFFNSFSVLLSIVFCVCLHDSIQVLIPSSHPTIQLLRTILSLILTNTKVRKLLSDFSLIGHNLFARGTSKPAGTPRPDQGALAHVDETGPPSPKSGP